MQQKYCLGRTVNNSVVELGDLNCYLGADLVLQALNKPSLAEHDMPCLSKHCRSRLTREKVNLNDANETAQITSILTRFAILCVFLSKPEEPTFGI